ncbi:putative integral membrane protein (TIGR02206 family) [Virgibacillus natechei]|uniref:Integral membrane protein (TIGR02206 family) n=1 Tax=Virgibacillus natechei TaxID=1216297 RepID=A0ABS4IGD4_9BACI|nr:TIGR02206 family membrane protein [Virgibacillus natechei]MBP1970002.1 putative integral membrane protein (TIGR02206 family) [Virgibacillus natechei]UZD13340.1 TIGR02206 family membrane protein [Virgibacillus natechei]
MREWFLNLEGEPFTWFGTSHIAMLFIYVIGLIILLLTYKKIKANRSLYNSTRWTLFGLLVLSEASYHIWASINGIWTAEYYIPLHLCSMAGITATIALVTHNKKLIIFTFFIGLIPAVMALLTPELHYEFPHFRFLMFFIQHMVISWVSIFLVITRSVAITFKSTMEAYGYLLLYAAITGLIINPVLNSNYLFLSHTPTASTPLDFLGSGIWYYINLCLLALAMFIALFGLYKLICKIRKC